ncbi:hypothetical protein LOZ36_002434 [Ophidiomyces ophidiicola]|nr:hypothetical protein LOZ36_002434 [Ophidiomyces ophidiicola]
MVDKISFNGPSQYPAARHAANNSATPRDYSNRESQPRAPGEVPALAASLLVRCQTLLLELDAFQVYLAGLGKPHLVELRQFKSVVQSELKLLEKLNDLAGKAVEEDEQARRAVEDKAQNEEDSEDENGGLGTAEKSVLHSLRSSNFPFYCTVWTVAKMTCTGLVGFSKKFYWRGAKRNTVGSYREDIESAFRNSSLLNGGAEDDEMPLSKTTAPALLKRNVLVDIVADHGEEWVKVSTITPSRLLFELAKQGWDVDSDSDDDPVEDGLAGNDSDGDDMIELVKLAADMTKAAKETRVRYKHPRIRFVLTKITEGEVPPVDRIIREIRKLGVTVECRNIAEDVPGEGSLIHDTGSLEALFTSLLPSPYPHRTPTLNVDCTLLLALVSDVSHIRNLTHAPYHHRAVTRQIQLEAQNPLIPSELWPAMGDKELVCTEEAAHRMREIVATIGTQTEKLRTQLLMGELDEDLARKELIARFQTLSDHKVPTDWKLPIRVVDSHEIIEEGLENGKLPAIAREVKAQLSVINASVFIYGWVTEQMTISSNRTVAKLIETLVEENRGNDDELSGPSVWTCDTARSLIGKEHNKNSRVA